MPSSVILPSLEGDSIEYKNTRIQEYKIKWPESRCRAIGTGIYRLNYPIKHKNGGNNLILKIKTGSSHKSRSTLIKE